MTGRKSTTRRASALGRPTTAMTRPAITQMSTRSETPGSPTGASSTTNAGDVQARSAIRRRCQRRAGRLDVVADRYPFPASHRTVVPRPALGSGPPAGPHAGGRTHLALMFRGGRCGCAELRSGWASGAPGRHALLVAATAADNSQSCVRLAIRSCSVLLVRGHGSPRRRTGRARSIAIGGWGWRRWPSRSAGHDGGVCGRRRGRPNDLWSSGQRRCTDAW